MPDAIDVRPHAWKNIQVLYDDGQYSAIWGDFTGPDEPERACLGVRWNGAVGKPGYPNFGKYSVWYVEPYFLTEVILLQLQKVVGDSAQIIGSATPEERNEWLNQINIALSQYRKKGPTGY